MTRESTCTVTRSYHTPGLVPDELGMYEGRAAAIAASTATIICSWRDGPVAIDEGTEEDPEVTVDVAGVVWVMAADTEVALGVEMIKTDRSGESTQWRDERLS